MTTKADFTEQEWKQVLEGPTSAGMIVITAQRGGTFRETVSMAKAYAEARQQHGQSELLDAIVAAKPDVDRTRPHSPEELDDYKRFTVSLAERVAKAHREGGRDEDPISDTEKAAIATIVEALG
jgi:hypothetical protein